MHRSRDRQPPSPTACSRRAGCVGHLLTQPAGSCPTGRSARGQPSWPTSPRRVANLRGQLTGRQRTGAWPTSMADQPASSDPAPSVANRPAWPTFASDRPAGSRTSVANLGEPAWLTSAVRDRSNTQPAVRIDPWVDVTLRIDPWVDSCPANRPARICASTRESIPQAPAGRGQPSGRLRTGRVANLLAEPAGRRRQLASRPRGQPSWPTCRPAASHLHPRPTGRILPNQRTNDPHKTPVKNREV